MITVQPFHDGRISKPRRILFGIYILYCNFVPCFGFYFPTFFLFHWKKERCSVLNVKKVYKLLCYNKT